MNAVRVLVVDDQRDVRRVFAEGIRTLGPDFDVIELPSGEEALLEAAHKPIDLLVADVRLPGISGLELVSRIRKRAPGLKIILVTGMTDPAVRKQVADAGADAFLFKPVNLADFLDAVERCLGLVETIFPLPPIAPDESPQFEAGAPPSLAEQISTLRADMAALAVALIDGSGQVLAQAGEISTLTPNPLLLPALVETLIASARLSHSIGASVPATISSVGGAQWSLCFTQLGQAHTLLAVLPGPLSAGAFGNAERLHTAALSLLTSLAVQENPVAAPAFDEAPPIPEPEEEIADLEVLPELDALFQQPREGQRADADAFWENLVENGGHAVANPDTLTYDQARKLGLAPKEK